MEHPWITFDLDLTRMSASFWMLLGEARSKCHHLARVPLPKAYADQLHIVSLAKGAHATTAIEGNTLSEETVQAIVERRPVDASPEYQVREVENVITAYNWVLGEIRAGHTPDLTPKLVADFNRMVLDGLDDLEDHVVPGEIRTDPVVVGPYRAPDAVECDALLAHMCEWLNSSGFAGEGDMRLPTAIIRASMAHLYLAWIHPFGDGNGRTARLCEYLVLVTSGVPTSAAHLISNHCNDTRDEYYRQLRYASESGGDVSKFLEYCAEGFVSGLSGQLQYVYDRQVRLTWHEHVAEQVTGRDPEMRHRRSLIADALLGRGVVTKKDLTRLTADLAAAYANCGPKTLTRDLNELVRLELIVEREGGYAAREDVLLNLLPLVVQEPPEQTDGGQVGP
ncbi:MAG TPA: Fic family protein [Acidimicrobiia bacterium]|nr:Fic family protein [Acidimicrobiia bacterium]